MSEPCGAGCGCSACAGESSQPSGPPVADPVAFRQVAIKARLLERISAIQIEGTRPLGPLGTREDDDPAIALLDAYAGSLHILAWNAARLLDDGVLSRTEDRDALVDLTSLLGYAPRPAISATTVLAFTLDGREGSAGVAAIPRGMKVASVPGQDEKPLTFETDATIEARASWNALLPVRIPLYQQVVVGTTSVTIAGVETLARPGDLVLVYPEKQEPPEKWLAARVVKVTRLAAPEPAQTRLDLTSSVLVPCPPEFQGAEFRNRLIVLGQRAAAFGATAPDLRLMSDSVRATHASPKKKKPVKAKKQQGLPVEWRDLVMDPSGTAAGGHVDLDAVYAEAMAGRAALFSLLDDPAAAQMGRIDAVAEGARKDFGLSSKTSRITVHGINLGAGGFSDKVRQTAIYLETSREKLLVVDQDVPLPSAASPDRIAIQGELTLPVGRTLVLSGEPWPGSPVKTSAEVATLASSTVAGGATELVFDAPLRGRFHAEGLRLFANCVSASHGETPSSGAEYIGSGNAASESPRFALKAAPLAHVPAATARGYAPALELRVGERLYGAEPTIFRRSSEDHVYMVRQRRGGVSEVQVAGRLHTGTHNVTALYRNGGGKVGNLAAGRLSSMLTPVLGVKEVSNVVAAAGGSDPETLEEMRSAAPKSIRTLDRVVSLADFEAFAQGYRGIGKALATELPDGMRRVVCLTIATTELLPPVAGSDVVTGLRDALARVAVLGRHVRIEGFDDLAVTLQVALAADPAFRRADVEARVRAALARDFGRPARQFGEPLARSAVLVSVQGIEGVVTARLEVFMASGGEPETAGRLPCPVPRIDGAGFSPAGLLSIQADAVTFTEMLP